MAVISRSNTAQAILGNVVTTLQAADSASNVDAFDAVILVDKERRGAEIKSKDTLCQVVYTGRREYDVDENANLVGTVLDATIVVTYRVNTADSIGNLTQLITQGNDLADLVLNALQADRFRSNNAGFVHQAGLAPTVASGGFSIQEIDQGWGRVAIPMQFGFEHTETGR